jgi:hypothetical protein
MIEIKETERKTNPAKRNIKLKDILVSEIHLVDVDGEDLTQKFIEAIPEGMETVELKVSFELDSPAEEMDIDDLSPDSEE